MSSFDREKERALTGVDLSRKGSIDARIHLLVTLLNGSNDFFTTSSCSGRIIIFDDNVSTCLYDSQILFLPHALM